MAERVDTNHVLQLINTLGKAYLDKGDYKRAIEKLEKALEMGIADRVVYRNISKAYLRVNRRDKQAIDVYEQVLRYEPNNKELCITLANHYLQEGRDDDSSFELYLRALSHDPEQKQILLRVLEFEYKKGNYEKAKARAQEAVAERRGLPESLTMYLRICWRLHSYEEVSHFFESMLSKKLEGILLVGLCKTYIQKERYAKTHDLSFVLSNTSCLFCAIFLNATRRVYTIDDLLVYLDIRRLLFEAIDYYGSDNQELISKFQSLKLNHEQLINANSLSDILNKLEFGLGERAISGGDKHEIQLLQQPDRVEEQLSSTSLLAVFCLSNYIELLSNFGRKITKRITETFISICSIQMEKHGHPLVWHGDDFVVVLTKEIDSLLLAVKNILEKLERYNSIEETAERVHVQVCLHRFENLTEFNSRQIVDDMTTILQLSRFGVSGKNIKYLRSKSAHERIILTDSFTNEFKEIKSFPTRHLGEFRGKPWNKKINLYELQWRNPIKSIDIGTIRRLGRFEIIENIYNNENRVVSKARDLQLNRVVILKAVSVSGTNLLDIPQFEDQFLAQARNLGRLHHQNLAVTYDVGEDSGLLYLVREYLEGTSLAYLMTSSKAHSKHILLENMIQVCRGIGYAHRMKIVHGHIRPTNIFIADNGDIKVTDFIIPILCKYLDASKAMDPEKAYYLTPEHISGEPIDAYSDIFSLGWIIYELLTGEKPFTGNTYEDIKEQISNSTPSPPSTISNDVEDIFDKITLNALQKEKTDRYQEVLDLEQDLHAALNVETFAKSSTWE